METEVHIVLNNGFTCPLAFLERFQQEIEFIAPGVPQGVLFTTEQLCGERFWKPLSDWKRTLAGSCMMHLVEHDRVSFEYVPRKGRNPYSLQFRIKASYKPTR
jgi:hypothetical protein